MKGIKCAFLATAQDAQIKRSKAGSDYLSLSVKLDENDDEQLWVAAWRDVDDLCNKIKPGAILYIEGTVKLRRWEDSDGNPKSALSISATKVDVLFDLDVKKERKAPTRRPASSKSDTNDLSLFSGPAAVQSGKKYDQPFNDEMPF